MLHRIVKFIRQRKPASKAPNSTSSPRVLLTASCVEAMRAAFEPQMLIGHESIIYLLGHTDGNTTLAVSIFKPISSTSPGSFHVEPHDITQGVRAAANYGVQIVSQVHTHPKDAYHSAGDIEGARMRYSGYISIVLPEYGIRLPSLEGAAIYHFSNRDSWAELSPSEVVVIPESV